MKAIDFKIGNYITVSPCNCKRDLVTEIQTINDEYVGFCAVCLGCGRDFWDADIESEIKPIQLTDDWIKDLGLIYDDNEKEIFLIKYIFYIRKDHEEDTYDIYESINDIFITSVKYVHQLQNLYNSLSGEELKRCFQHKQN